MDSIEKELKENGISYDVLDLYKMNFDCRMRPEEHYLAKKITPGKDVKEIVEKEVIVKTIQDTYIGCAFVEESGFTDRTLGFYLMK